MEGRKKISNSAASGMVALVFLILGFQIAVFVMKVVERPVQRETASEEAISADTAVVEGVAPAAVASGRSAPKFGRSAPKPGRSVSKPYAAAAKRRIESFRFNPNTVSEEELVRLGLSPKQAASIGNYRSKGGRFRKKEDFAKMYVVSDTLYSRLEPYIDIPKLELNAADSAALVQLKGIGPYYALKILDYRDKLGGFCDVSQLMEVPGIDSARFSGLCGDIRVDSSAIRKIDIWQDSAALLALHPYIGEKGARRIERFRKVYDLSLRTLPNLLKDRVFTPDQLSRLSPYLENQGAHR